MTFYPTAPAPAIPAGDPTAVVGKRIAAAAIDALIFTIFSSIVFFGIFAESVDTEDFSGDVCAQAREVLDQPVLCFDVGDTVYYSEGGESLLVLLLVFGASFANHGVLQGATGASIGKHALGLRVIKSETGRRASFGPNALRWVIGVFDAGCCFPVGLIMVIATKGHRRLGDMASGTLVVDKGSVGVVPVVPGLTSPQFIGGPYATSFPPAGSPFTPPQPASPTGWPQQPVSPTGWPPPSASPAPPPPAPSPPIADPAPAANTPTWDQQRNTYVIFDAAQNQWMQWDDTGQQWRPISQ